ncbi:MAG: 3-methyladenine DNA glycosylase [Campylobacteraceae bacterium]
MNSFDLLKALKETNSYDESFTKVFNSPTFEVVVGAILTQQTKWENVEAALDILRQRDLLSIENFAELDAITLAHYIKSCGFANQKSKRLLNLSRNILNDFENIESFRENVNREWLLSQKGLGYESSDYILCYACKQPVMVVDSYTARLLKHYGFEFESYDELQNWFYDGILGNFEKVEKLYSREIDEVELYARFHGKIVNYCKKNMKGERVVKELLVLD